MQKVLIVANQTIGSTELSTAVTDRIAAGTCHFHLLVPVPPTPPSAISVGLAAVESAATAFMVLPDLRALAEERLVVGLEWLQSLGADATGEVGAIDTVAAVERARRARRVRRGDRVDVAEQIVEVAASGPSPEDREERDGARHRGHGIDRGRRVSGVELKPVSERRSPSRP